MRSRVVRWDREHEPAEVGLAGRRGYITLGFGRMCTAHRACYNDEMAGAGGERTRSASRPVAVGVAALAALLLVVAAGTGLQLGVADGVADASDVAARAIVGGLAGAIVAGAALVAVRRAGLGEALAVRGATAALLAIVAVAALGATAAVSTAPLHPEVATVEPLQSAGRAVGAPEAAAVDEDRSAGSLPDWLQTVMMAIAVVAMLLVVVGGVRSAPAAELFRRYAVGQEVRRDAEPVVEDVDDDLPADAAADVFEDAASIGDGLDPRAAIIAAYARLLTGLERVGCARRANEAPEEHLRRSLETLRVDDEHLRLVVDKFLVARFSTHPLTSVDADAARAGLRAVGAQLRDLAAVAPA